MKNMRKKNGNGRRYVSLFTKSVVAFIIIGIIPLFAIGLSVYNAYADNIQNTLLMNLSQMTLYVGKNITNIFDEMEQNTKYIYNYRAATDYDYFYELMQDPSITEAKRNTMITGVLRNIVYRDQYIDHVLFITPDGRSYSSMRPPEIMVNTNSLMDWHHQNYQDGLKKETIIPTHLTTYYFYSKIFDFSFSRNIMNTKTIQSTDHDVLGTLYIDVNMKYLTNIIKEANFDEKHDVSIIDKKQKIYVYSQFDYNIGKDVEDLKPWVSRMDSGKKYIKTNDSYLIYSLIPDSDWIVVDKVAISEIENSYKTIRDYTIILLCIGAALLGIIYLFYSRWTNQPIQQVKEAMGEIQKGDLDVRLKINSNDEVGIVANGLNQMTENLKNYINRVYVAEINQKNAELETLKTQIQPHYLYNTLDVIRMTAITNDDKMTAEMLDNLSAQLKYLIGTTQDMVTLNAEIENIRNYFNLVRIRFDNRFELEIDVPDDLLSLTVPRLILQPLVENAVTHGLRPKDGEGLIAIYAKHEEANLQITVMDNGVGMDEEQLAGLQALLKSPGPGQRTGSTWESIGIKNVNDRIKLIYGPAYGLEISSFEGMGTIVNYHLPFVMGGNDDV